MGIGIVPFYEPQVPRQALYDGDGKGLALEWEALNEIAAAAGLKSLREFAANEFEDYDGGDSEPPELVFRAISDGLPTIEGLLREIRSKPDLAVKLRDSDGTLEELEELARSLRAADSRGARFCLFFM